MTTNTELRARVDHLESLLAERDRKDAEVRAATLAAQQATDDAKDAAARAEAAMDEREMIRRGSWVTHLLGQADANVPVDFDAIETAIPKDGFPPDVDESAFVLSGGATIRPEQKIDVAATTLGKLLASMTLKI